MCENEQLQRVLDSFHTGRILMCVEENEHTYVLSTTKGTYSLVSLPFEAWRRLQIEKEEISYSERMAVELMGLPLRADGRYLSIHRNHLYWYCFRLP